jgi:glycosyltransferase involved in cell wall biosynthesis
MNILIGMPCQSGVVPVSMLQSLLMLHKPYPCGFAVVERQRVDKARNHIAMECLKGGFDYLLFVDDDNPIPPDTLEKFIEDDKDIVMAPILARNQTTDGKHNLCCFYSEEIDVWGKPLRLYFPVDKFKDEGYLHKVDACGSGCTLIKREVLEKLHQKHQDYIFEFGDIRFKEIEYKGKKYDRRTMSEDCEFSERAIDAGFEIWIDDRVRPVHLTQMGGVKYG